MILEIILGSLLFTSIAANVIQLRRQETLETWFDDLSQDLYAVQSDFDIIEEKQWFEKDDEVGDTFRRLKESLQKVQKYTGVENAKET